MPWVMVKELLVTSIGTSPFCIISLQEVTFLFLHIMVMLENIVDMSGNIFTTLMWQDDYCGYTFWWFWGILETILGELGSTLQKFILYQKHKISIVLFISHIFTWKTNLNFSIMSTKQTSHFAYHKLVYLTPPYFSL